MGPRRRPSGLEVDPATSKRLANVRQHGTEPELVVRQAATAIGLRYRVRNRDLPGSPDLANRSRRWAVFVHGCFWHGHQGCPRATIPTRNAEFWLSKFSANQARDARAAAELEGRGYEVVTLWECELGDIARLRRRLIRRLAHRV